MCAVPPAAKWRGLRVSSDSFKVTSTASEELLLLLFLHIRCTPAPHVSLSHIEAMLMSNLTSWAVRALGDAQCKSGLNPQPIP